MARRFCARLDFSDDEIAALEVEGALIEPDSTDLNPSA